MITKEGLSLRRFYEEDRDILAQLADNPNVAKYMAPRFPSPYRLQDADAWIALTRKEKQPLNFAIEWQRKLVGGIGIAPCPGLFVRTAELGYWLGESFWGRCLAAKAVGLLTPYVFSELSFIRMQAIIFAENRNSGRVLEKNGFTKEGILRKHLSKDGIVADAILYAKLAAE